MNLLLLLSALLSALSGATASARAVQPAVALARQAEAAVAVRQTARLVPARPVASLPRAVAAIEGAAWVLAPAAPLFLSRRRE